MTFVFRRAALALATASLPVALPRTASARGTGFAGRSFPRRYPTPS